MKMLLGGLVHKALVALAWILTTASALAQGTVYFVNIGLGFDAPFFDEQGVRLLGPSYVAQMYYWNPRTDSGFDPVEVPVSFTSLTNYAGYFGGGTATLPLQPGSPAWVQVRAWRIDGGTTFEEAALAGGWTGVSEILFVPFTGGAGLPPSTPALLIGLQYPGRPLMVRQPQSRTVLAGTSATLSVVASSGVRMAYQWHRQPGDRPDGLIPGATNATYTTPPLAANTTYWVAITNTAGSTLSAPATIIVLPAPPMLSLQLDAGLPVLTLAAAPGLAYRIDYRTNLTAAAWTPLVELTLSTSPFTFTDPAATNTPSRFYRAVAP